MNNNLNELIERVKEKDLKTYDVLAEDILFLREERIKIVGNNLRNMIGIEQKKFDKDRIIGIMEKIRELSNSYGVEINIPNNWEGIEKWLRLSILEDVQTEFESQK